MAKVTNIQEVLDKGGYVPITEQMRHKAEIFHQSLVDLDRARQEWENLFWRDPLNWESHPQRKKFAAQEEDLNHRLTDVETAIQAISQYDSQLRNIKIQINSIEREYKDDFDNLFGHPICGAQVTQLYNEKCVLEKQRAAIVIEYKRKKHSRSTIYISQRDAEPLYADDPILSQYGFLVVKQGKKYGVVDKDGNLAIPFEYGYLGVTAPNNPQLGALQNGYLVACKDNKIGIIDMNNTVIVPCQYSPVDLLDLHYPHIHFNLYPSHKSDIERETDLKTLKHLCATQDKHYDRSDDPEVWRRGKAHSDSLAEHILAIDCRDYVKAQEICTHYNISMPRNEPHPQETTSNDFYINKKRLSNLRDESFKITLKILKSYYNKSYQKWMQDNGHFSLRDIFEWRQRRAYKKLSAQEDALSKLIDKAMQEQNDFIVHGYGVKRIDLTMDTVTQYQLPQKRNDIMKQLVATEVFLAAVERSQLPAPQKDEEDTYTATYRSNREFDIEITTKKLNDLYHSLSEVEQRMNVYTLDPLTKTQAATITPLLQRVEKQMQQRDNIISDNTVKQALKF